MAKFIAKIDIGEFKKGQEVPEKLALVWNKMYVVAPCELLQSLNPVVIEQPKIEQPKEEKIKKRK